MTKTKACKEKTEQRRQNLIKSGAARECRFVNEQGKAYGCKKVLLSTRDVPSYSEIAKGLKTARANGVKGQGRHNVIPIRTSCGHFDVAASLAAYIENGHRDVPDNRKIVAYYKASSGYKKRVLAAAKPSGEGNIVIDTKFADLARKKKNSNKKPKTPKIIATPEELAEACRSSIKQARGFRYHGFVSKFDKTVPEKADLRNYSFEIECAGHVANMRADYAFAMAKRDWADGLDAYGKRPVGVVVSGKKCRQFKLYYGKTDRGGNNLSNIDHVVPQSKGGKTYVANLHMMGERENAEKGSGYADVIDNATKNAINSARAMIAFARGFSAIKGTLDAETRRGVGFIMRHDLAYSARAVMGLA